MVRLEDEMRALLQSHYALAVDVTTPDTLLHTMKRQTQREIWETDSALRVLWRSSGLLCSLNALQLKEITRIIDGMGRGA